MESQAPPVPPPPAPPEPTARELPPRFDPPNVLWYFGAISATVAANSIVADTGAAHRGLWIFLVALVFLYLSAGLHMFSKWRQSHHDGAAVVRMEREHAALVRQHQALSGSAAVERTGSRGVSLTVSRTIVVRVERTPGIRPKRWRSS